MCICNFTAGLETLQVTKVPMLNVVQGRYLPEEPANCYYVKLTTLLGAIFTT